MTRDAVAPPGVRPDLPLSPAIRSGDHLFLTGMTGMGPGADPSPEAQFNAAFDKVEAVLRAAGVDLDAVVEATTYHLALATHFDAFEAVWRARLAAPYPAWTAVEVAGLRRPGALVEMRVVARVA